MEIEFSIVGLVNYIDKEKLSDFYTSAPGKDVIIKLEPGNVYDPSAIVTLLDGDTIGHVRSFFATTQLYHAYHMVKAYLTKYYYPVHYYYCYFEFITCSLQLYVDRKM